MTNEQLTNEVIKMIAVLARVEEKTSALPDLKNKIEGINNRLSVMDHMFCELDNDKIIEQVHDNTKFRKGIIKFVWISVGAFVTSVLALIFALINGGKHG